MFAKILKSRHLWIIGMAGIVMFLLFISATGCGNKDNTKTQTVARSTPRPTPTPVAMPTPAPQPAPIVVAPEPVVQVAEAPREVTYEEAEAAYYDRRYKEATEMFVRYTERKTDNPWGHYMLGLSAWKAGEHGTAELAFERALDLDPQHVKSWVNLSRVLLHDNRAEDAITKIDQAIAIDPQSNTAYRLRGRALHQLNRKAEAVESYRRAIEIDNEDVWAMNNLGLAFLEVGQLEDALPPLARAVEIDNGVPLFYNNLGMTLERMGHYRAAQQAYQSAVDLDDTYFNAASNLVRIMDVREESGLEPVNLAAVAQLFVEKIAGWRAASMPQHQGREPEEMIASEPDTKIDESPGTLVSHTESSESGEDEE